MKLILLRHGETLAQEMHLYCGSTDLPLSCAGREKLRPPKIDVRGFLPMTSGMKRADETLMQLFSRKPLMIEPRFREMDFGSFEMHSYEELKISPEYISWITDEHEQVCCPGGESTSAFRARVRAGLEALIAAEKDVLLVCHGGVIAAIMQALFPREQRHMFAWQPRHGCGYMLKQEGKQWSYEEI